MPGRLRLLGAVLAWGRRRWYLVGAWFWPRPGANQLGSLLRFHIDSSIARVILRDKTEPATRKGRGAVSGQGNIGSGEENIDALA